MRRKKHLESYLVQAESDLVKARLDNSWNNGLVNYLLGQVVTLTIVLEADLDWTTVYETAIERVDRSVANIRKKYPVDGQAGYCQICGNEIVYHSHGSYWRHKREGVDPPGYMDADGWHICDGPVKPKDDGGPYDAI